VPRPILHSLSSGLRVVCEPDLSVRSAALSWLVPAGAACDPENRLGRAALWEELLHRGAGNRDSRAHADALDVLGAGVSTGVETRFLRVSSTYLGENLESVLPLIVEMVRQPRFDADSIEPARSLCVSSLKSLEDEPAERCLLLAKEIHAPPPFNRSGLGTQEGLLACTREDLVGGWRASAVPEGSILALAGAFDPQEAMSWIEQQLGDWEGTTPEPSVGGAPQRGYHHELDETNQVQIVVLHDAPSERDEDSMLEKVVTSVLSGGMSGRLFTQVRERRSLCYSVSASYATDRDFGRVVAYVGTTPEKAQESLDVLLEELHGINSPQGAVTQEEFDRAIIGMKSRVVMSGESMSARSGALARDVFRRGEPRTLEQIAAQIESVTLEQVNTYLARRELGEMTICTLGPAALGVPTSV
jgi:predicted Zn-dependent peptidase